MFEKQERQGIIVYLYYNRDARKLNKYGDVLYHSRNYIIKFYMLTKKKQRILLKKFQP